MPFQKLKVRLISFLKLILWCGFSLQKTPDHFGKIENTFSSTGGLKNSKKEELTTTNFNFSLLDF